MLQTEQSHCQERSRNILNETKKIAQLCRRGAKQEHSIWSFLLSKRHYFLMENNTLTFSWQSIFKLNLNITVVKSIFTCDWRRKPLWWLVLVFLLFRIDWGSFNFRKWQGFMTRLWLKGCVLLYFKKILEAFKRTDSVNSLAFVQYSKTQRNFNYQIKSATA